jgi:hypothetical protein
MDLSVYSALLLSFFRFSSLLYYTCTLSFRLCFQEHFGYTSNFLTIIIIDYLVDLIIALDYLFVIYNNSTEIIVVPVSTEADMEGGQANMSSKDFIKTLRKTSQSSLGDMAFTFRSGNYYEMALQIFLAIPCEAIAFAAGYDNYEWFRITKLARFYYSRVYWSDVKFHLIKCKVNFEGGWDRVVLFCITQAVFSHVAACIYYRIAVTSIDSGNYSNWLLHDNNAYIDNVTGELVYIRKMDAVYLRAFYWAVQTVVHINTIIHICSTL